MSKEQFGLFLDEMQHLHESQEETAQKLAKGTRHNPYSFHRKGNENQFQFCEDVKENITAAQSSISRGIREAGKPALEKAKASLNPQGRCFVL